MLDYHDAERGVTMGCLLNKSLKSNSNVFLLVALTTFNFGEVLIGWIIIKLSVQIFQPLSLHCRRDNFVYEHY